MLSTFLGCIKRGYDSIVASMDERLSDIVDSLWKRIMMVMQGDDGELCAEYLRTSYQKCLFAEERLKSLTEHVDDYKKRLARREILDSLFLAMDYDHLLISLRSALRNLTKLVEAVISLQASGHVLPYQGDASLRKTLSGVENDVKLQANKDVSKLLAYLNEKVGQDWYKDLVEPGIVISHDKFREHPKVSAHNISRQLLDFRFLLPDTMATDDNSEGSIIAYSASLINQVEGFLVQSFLLLKKCLRPV